MFFRLATSVGLRKNSDSPWGIEPQSFGFRAPMLYHWATETPLWARSISFPAKKRFSKVLTHVKTFGLHVYGIKEPSTCRTDLHAIMQRSSVSSLWRQLVIGQSNDITRRWGFPRIKVISTKTSVIRERQKYIFVWCLTSPRCSTWL